jgi:hypothetical protein
MLLYWLSARRWQLAMSLQHIVQHVSHMVLVWSVCPGQDGPVLHACGGF